MNEARTQLFDVASVGYGPTGATLANLLAQCNLSVVVIERNEVMYHLPRAVHFDDETMRIFQTVGVANSLSKKVRINPGMRFVDHKKSVILEWPRPQEIGSQGWHASYRLHQPDLEQLLRAKLSGYSNEPFESSSVYEPAAFWGSGQGQGQILVMRLLKGSLRVL